MRKIYIFFITTFYTHRFLRGEVPLKGERTCGVSDLWTNVYPLYPGFTFDCVSGDLVKRVWHNYYLIFSHKSLSLAFPDHIVFVLYLLQSKWMSLFGVHALSFFSQFFIIKICQWICVRLYLYSQKKLLLARAVLKGFYFLKQEYFYNDFV